MSFLAKFAAPLIAAGGDLLGGALGAFSAKQRQEDAQDFSADQFARRYQITTADMKAAGLNPMLAYSQGGGNAPTSSAASASSFGSPGTAAIQAQLAQAQLANAQAAARKTNAEANVIEGYGLPTAGATLDEILSRTGLTSSQIHNVNMQTAKMREEINNIPFERDRLVAAARQLTNLAGLNSVQSLTEEQRKQLVTRQAQLIVQQTKLAEFDVKAAESSGNLGREFGQYGPMMKLLLDVIRTAKR